MTMFNNKLVVALKHNDKILRESKDKDGNVTTFLPFGSEYSIFIKNLNSVRALVKVSLDGQSVTDGEDLVVYGNSELNLERFLKAGNMNSGNRFKFIERSAKVEAHRGIEAEDGLLRVEFQFEKVTPKPIVVETIHKHYHDYYKVYPHNDPWWYPNKPYYYNCGVYGSAGLNNLSAGAGDSMIGSAVGNITANVCNSSLSADHFTQTNSTSISGAPTDSVLRSRSLKKSSKADVAETQQVYDSHQVNEAGITVAGSVSEQKFQNAAWFAVDDEKFVIVLKLLGEVGGQVVKQAVTTKTAQICSTCGTRNRGKLAQFCRECGTALEKVGQSPKRRVASR